MIKVKDNVYKFESTKRSWAYLIVLPGGSIIVDTSMPGSDGQMLSELAEMHIDPTSVRHILLTHNDADHIGSAAALQTATGAKVWLHEADSTPNLSRVDRPVLKRVLDLFMKPKLPTIKGVITKDAEIIPDIFAVHTPGHTPGHTVYLYKDMLFSGDAAKVKKDGSLGLLPGFLTANRKIALQSIQSLRAIEYSVICPSHQKPQFFN